MTAATTTPLQSRFGPIVADAAGTITVQEASDVLEYSRLRVCELLNPRAGRVLVSDVLALKSSVQRSALEPSPCYQARRMTGVGAGRRGGSGSSLRRLSGRWPTCWRSRSNRLSLARLSSRCLSGFTLLR
jgi:hypothetical protein